MLASSTPTPQTPHHPLARRPIVRRLALLAAVAAPAPLAACGDDSSRPTVAADAETTETVETAETTEPGEPATSPVPVVLDYSPTVSDNGALLYLAARSDVDLLAVTLPSTGEAECGPGVRITRALLTIAGRGDVPIGCGDPVAADGRNEWPAEWREAANHLPGVVLPGLGDTEPLDAEELLGDVIRDADRAVTIVALAPLTNLASVLNDEPDLADGIERIVTMGGAIDVPGNVEAAPAAEWNYFVDPPAVRDVLTSGVDVLVVPLDATDDVPWTDALIARIATSTHPVARAEHQLVTAAPSLDGIYLWDELATIAAFDASAVATEPMTLAVDEDGALTVDPDGSAVTVATSADVEAATTELLRSLNGGDPIVFDDLTEDEAAYYSVFATTMGGLADQLDALEEPAESTAPTDVARLLVDSMWGVLDQMSSELDEVPPPDSVAAEHAAFVDTIDRAIAIRGDLLAAIDRSEADDPWQVLFESIEAVGSEPVDGLSETCRSLEAYSIVRNGPELCSLFSE